MLQADRYFAPVFSLFRLPWSAAFLLAAVFPSAAAEAAEVGIGYLHDAPHRETLSLLDVPAADNGLAGARLGIEDDNTTGKFLSQHFELVETKLSGSADAGAAVVDLAERRVAFVLADLPADAL